MQGWKTVAFNSVTALMGVFMATDWNTVVTDPKIAGYVVLGMSMVNMVLRAVTSTPVGQAAPKN